MGDPLHSYRAKRDFAATPEPSGRVGAGGAHALAFVVQKHAARSLHYDFRLELDGTLKSWAIPKGPSLDPAVKRMAVQVEDHPLSYGGFEGEIPPGHYGAGRVIVWDRGEWRPAGDPRAGYAAGKLSFELRGDKLHGLWALVRMRGRGTQKQEPWLLIKEQDEAARPSPYDVLVAEPKSVLSGTEVGEAGAVRGVGAAPAAPAARKRRPAPRAGDEVAGVRISHGERVIDAASGLTKLDLARYYDRVAEAMLPHLRDRPVSLVRAPEGVGGELFFQKHAAARSIAGITLLDRRFDPEHEPLMAIASREALIGAVQMNAIEFHTGNATTRRINQPDRVIFDLDPGEGVQWPQVLEGAQLLRGLLDDLGLASWVKTSGGRGLHLVLPLAAKEDWAAVHDFAQSLVEHLARTLPERFVAKSGASNRGGRIFADYLRNGRGATTVAAFSARARPGLGVSVPLRWDDLPRVRAGDAWDVADLPDPPPHPGPWAGYDAKRQTIGRALLRLAKR